MLLITQVRGNLSFQRPLENGLDQVAEHGASAGQPQPPIGVLRPLQKGIQHLIPEQLPHRNLPRGIFPAMMSHAPRARDNRLARNRPRH